MASGSGSDSDSFEVAEILGKRGRGRNIEYLVRWEGFDEDGDSWEPAGSLSHAQDLIDEYLNKGKSGKLVSKSSSVKSTRSTSGSSTTVTKTTSVLKEVQTSSVGRGGRRSYLQESSYSTRALGEGTQSESSSPEASPRLARKIREQREDLQAVRNRLLEKAKIDSSSLSGKRRTQSGILSLNNQDLPVLILIICLLFIALTFVVAQK